MKTRILILSILFVLSLVSARAADVTRIAGVWQWTPKDQTVTIKADGTCTSTYNVTGTWKYVGVTNRYDTYEIKWSSGFVDTLLLNKDASLLMGTNQYGEQVSSFTRIK